MWKKNSSKAEEKGSHTESTHEKVLTATTILDFCSEDHLENAQELIVRDGGFTSLEPAACQHLSQLRTISLSHNKFTNFEGFSSFLILNQLNMNFNSLTSIQGLQCKKLESLYLSHNQLTNKALEILPSTVPVLRVLCLYMNKIQNLKPALSAIRRLPKLKDLSLAGNPCAFGSEYKHKTVQTLPRLQVLDGDTLQRIDHDLARMFFKRQKANGAGKSPARVRPSTAPTSKAASTSGPRSMFHSVVRGDVKLFRSSFLNTNPILLEYLAKSTLSKPNQTTRSHMKTFAKTNESEIASSAASAPSSPTGRHGSTDPYATIRKLLQTIDDLQGENDELKEQYDETHQSTMDSLATENRHLQLECANMYAVQEANKMLKARVKALERKVKKKASGAELEKRFSKLEHEYVLVVQERNELRDRMQASKLQEELARPRTAAQLIVECEDDLGTELAELLQRNKQSLKEIREDLRTAKREIQHADKKMVRDELRDRTGKKSRKKTHTHEATATTSSLPDDPGPPRRKIDMRLLEGRPNTPNLLGRPIKTSEDIVKANEALKEAKARMKALEKDRRQHLHNLKRSTSSDRPHDVDILVVRP